jgi:hypothetical protein
MRSAAVRNVCRCRGRRGPHLSGRSSPPGRTCTAGPHESEHLVWPRRAAHILRPGRTHVVIAGADAANRALTPGTRQPACFVVLGHLRTEASGCQGCSRASSVSALALLTRL